MNKEMLPKRFFKDNPIEELSAANLCHFKMMLARKAEAQQMVEDKVSMVITPERRARIAEEKKNIAALSTGEEVVAFIRRKYDIVNQSLLCQKVLSMQEQAIPLILRRYSTTLQDMFVDTAVQILAQAEKHYAEALLEMYSDIRDPYAKSMACLVFGVQHLEQAAPLLYEEYKRMKREYTKESLCQGPLLGLYVLYGKA